LTISRVLPYLPVVRVLGERWREVDPILTWINEEGELNVNPKAFYHEWKTTKV